MNNPEILFGGPMKL